MSIYHNILGVPAPPSTEGMKEVFVLVDTFNGKSVVLDRCMASSIVQAQSIFDGDGWTIGESMSEADFMHELQLNAFESQ